MSEETSPYQAPESDVIQPNVSSGEWGSVEKALAGESELEFGQAFSDAWALTKGAKTKLLIAILVYILVLIPVSIASGFVAGMLGALIGAAVSQLIVTAVSTPMYGGLFLMSLRRACGREFDIPLLFSCFGKILPLLILYIVMITLVLIGVALLIIPGIYLFFAYIFAIPLMIDKDMGIWEALETSRKGVTKKWFTVFGLFFCMGLLMMVSAIPLMIGLIWTVPMNLILYAVMYRNLFGPSPENG